MNNQHGVIYEDPHDRPMTAKEFVQESIGCLAFLGSLIVVGAMLFMFSK
ncbi:MAG: hypothetical protein LBN05_08455 [Oscillospiraceae bacterium]|nr:hypothetical protein [Oscillospiraceae bacterium]